MSDHGFHVHGPRDHALEHAPHGEPESASGQLAVITAVLATVGATFPHTGGATQANAGLHKNDAATRKAEAANQWAYYQAEEAEITTIAERLDAESAASNEMSSHPIHDHHRWAQATAVLQVSIAKAAIALLTKRKWLVHGVFVLGAIGAGLGTPAWMGL